MVFQIADRRSDALGLSINGKNSSSSSIEWLQPLWTSIFYNLATGDRHLRLERLITIYS